MTRTALTLLLAATACTSPGGRDTAWRDDAQRLAGSWNVRLDAASGSRVAGVSPIVVAGSMTLALNRAVDRQVPGLGLPTNYGTYEIDFRPLGFVPSGGRVPALFAGVTPGDTLEIDFESDRFAFTMRMRGALRPDTVRGTWFAMESRNSLAAGTFVMTRR